MESIKSETISMSMPNMGRVIKIFGFAAMLAGIVYLGHINFLIFHTVVEIFSIVIAFTMTVISMSTYEVNKDSRIVFLGIAYGFIACFDLIHTLSYKGMGVFPQLSPNIPTQLWIIARYMESISLLIALWLPKGKLDFKKVLSIYASLSGLLLLSILYWYTFPDCYSDSSGLTCFKIISEYIISGILLIGILYLLKKRPGFSNRIRVFLFLSLITTAISEIFFTNYIGVYDFSNLIGHVFKLISFYLIYIAMVESSLKHPYLAQVELNRLLNEKNDRLEKAMDQLRLEYARRKAMEELQKKMEIKQALLEKAKEIDELKTNFFCTISHELKTPVNVILGSVQLMDILYSGNEKCSKNGRSHKYIKVIKQNCNRLIKLVNDLVDITKIDSGFMQMNLKNYNIVAVIEDIVLSVVEYIESKGISLVFDTDIEEKRIGCDADKLERVMLNLLSNAIKFTPSGGSISVNMRDKGEKIEISVRDTGIGIPENMLEAVFDRFRQVDSSFTRKKEGNGIGLCLVKSIIELHGGKISLNSEVGKGSEFIIELPGYLVENGSECSEIAVARESNVERISIEFSDIYDI